MGLSNTKYNMVLKTYEDRQMQNRRTLDDKRDYLYKTIPEYQQLDLEIASLSVEQGKKLILGDEHALEDLRTRLSALFQKKSALLEQNDLPSDYLDPVFACSDCKDTGYQDGEKCHCLKQKLIEVLYDQSNIKSVLQNENFTSFSYLYYNEEESAKMHKTVEECKSFIQNFDHCYRNLLFQGDVGTGKTFLSNCIAKEIIEKGYSVVYFTAFQLFDVLAKNTFESSKQSDDMKEVYEHIFDCDLLIIDDLGTETVNSFVTSQLFLILNERHIRKHSTIISSNLSLQKMNDIYSERSLSRILGNYSIFKFQGDDIRLKKRKQDNRK